MPSLQFAREHNQKHVDALFATTSLPVMVVTGGTNGIGEAIATAFARYTKGHCHIVIIGRSQEAADRVLATFPKPTESSGNPGWKHEFVPCDLSLMSEVHRVTKELANRLPKINFLVLCAGIVTWPDRDETTDGLDRRLAIRYYARWVFLHELIRSVEKAKDTGEEASVLSVMGSSATTWPTMDREGNTQDSSLYAKFFMKIGGAVPTVNKQDLGFKESPSAFKTMFAAGVYNDLMLDAFADRHTSIPFAHAYPGWVRTAYEPLKEIPRWYLKPLGFTLNLIVKYILAKDQNECAEHMLFALFDGEPGSYSRNEKGDVTRIASKKAATTDPENDKSALWEHTAKATGTIVA